MIGRRIILASAILLFLIGGSAWSAEDPTQGRVGGIAVAEGEVAIRIPAGGRAGMWSEAGRNDPVASGMAVRTAAASRAVLRVGADLIAFSEASEADIVTLDKAGTVLALRGGRVGVRLSGHEAGRATEIATPNGKVRLFAPGEYEIAAGDGKSPARLAVLAGTARISGDGLDTVVASGGAALLSGGGPVTLLSGDTAEDAFVAWWRAQTRSPADAPTLRHVSAALTGHETLDEHGAWESVAGIGAVWFPSELPRDWAPYRYGRWRWIGPWGWTWIDDMKWGFATSHHGRWTHVEEPDSEAGRWGWVPGERVEEPVFLPAAVAFLGTAGVGLSYPDAFRPAVAWFPLAPGEVYWPSFTDDPEAIRRLNEGSGADPAMLAPTRKGDPPADLVTGEYRNRRHASVVPRTVFIGGKPVAEALIKLPARRLENAPLLAGSPGIEPPAANPSVRTAASPAAPANLATARETLARIVTSREPGRRAAEPAVSRISVAKTQAAKTRDARSRTVVRRKLESARGNQTAGQARPAPASKTRLRRVETRAKPPKSQAAALRRADARGG